ncbi:hypothetical protein GW17_00003008 [Ensete ventricosum]|nr:hypothetical protein GW17_00003008 [Ensete ventricosum]
MARVVRFMDDGRLGDGSSWERLYGSDEGCERWLCMAEEGQRRLAGGGNRRIDVWGSCCGRGNGDMVAGDSSREEEGGKRSTQSYNLTGFYHLPSQPISPSIV